jgi:hypothetical protein
MPSETIPAISTRDGEDLGWLGHGMQMAGISMLARQIHFGVSGQPVGPVPLAMAAPDVGGNRSDSTQAGSPARQPLSHPNSG